MSRSAATFRLLAFLLLGALGLGLAGCGDGARTSSAAELDEPAYREGQALLKTGRRQEALNSFLKVIDRRGDEAPESHLEVGLLYLQHINDPLSAIYHFKKYLALRPNSPQAPLVKQRIDAAMRDFARTLPAQSLENQPQRVDLVAALDRLKQENEMLKQELADVKGGRGNPAVSLPGENTPVATAPPASGGFNFPVESIPTVRTRPLPAAPPKPAPSRSASAVTSASAAPTTASAKPAGARRHTIQPGDTLSKLAQQYYANRAKWHDIYAANRDIMKSETDLKTGMVLKIP
ncbi:MAG: LysM peptidoglycan-binding domain-containing protein [Lacunisphaera sp.]|nr:LysM peptidoglycan-binding domain-containing protein [Lacunisphaera sp.]